MKTINGKLFKYNPNSKHGDKQSDETVLSSATGVSSAVAKVTLIPSFLRLVSLQPV